MPEAKDYEPAREFMMSDLKRMRDLGISTDGSWTGRDYADAVGLMVADLAARLERGPVLPLADLED